MRYTPETEWARPYIEELADWMRRNRITLTFTDGYGRWRHERWLIHPNASDEQLLTICMPYFDRHGCQDCPWSYRPHPMIQSGANSFLHLCTKMAIAKGIVNEKDIEGGKMMHE